MISLFPKIASISLNVGVVQKAQLIDLHNHLYFLL